MAFEVKKPNPIYGINTKTTHGPKVATEQTGDQNDELLKKAPVNKGLYSIAYAPKSSTDNKKSMDPKIMQLEGMYQSFFRKDRTNNSLDIRQDADLNCYIGEKQIENDTGALSSIMGLNR